MSHVLPVGSFTTHANIFVSPTPHGVQPYNLQPSQSGPLPSTRWVTPLWRGEVKREAQPVPTDCASSGSSSLSLFGSREEEEASRAPSLSHSAVQCAAVVGDSPLVVVLLRDYSSHTAAAPPPLTHSRQFLYLYDALEDQTLAQVLLTDQYVESIQVNKDYILALSSTQLRVIHLHTLECVLTQPTRDVPNPHLAAALSIEADGRLLPDGRTRWYYRLAYPDRPSTVDRASQKRGAVWLRHLPAEGPPHEGQWLNCVAAHRSAIVALALTASGDCMVTASVTGQVLRVYRTSGLQLLHELRRGSTDSIILAVYVESKRLGSGKEALTVYCVSDHGTLHIFRGDGKRSGVIYSSTRIVLPSVEGRPGLPPLRNRVQLMPTANGMYLWVAHYYSKGAHIYEKASEEHQRRADLSGESFVIRLLRYSLTGVDTIRTAQPLETFEIPFST